MRRFRTRVDRGEGQGVGLTDLKVKDGVGRRLRSRAGDDGGEGQE